jgi:hypothetical protein
VNLLPLASDTTAPAIPSRRRAAFSLVEILIAVTLMSVIVLGLMAMFAQTQRAFRLGMNQTDVLEAGRMATDMIVREMEEITPSGNASAGFYSELLDVGNVSRQKLPGTDALRTNLMSDLFFVTRQNRSVTGIGYFVRTDNTVPGSFGRVGTLYRYETNVTALQFDWNPFGLWTGFNQARNNGAALNVSRIVEGVVHFQIRTFDTNGIWLNRDDLRLSDTVRSNTYWSLYTYNYSDHFFTNTLVPAYVELELGILEDESYDRYKAMPASPVQDNYFTNRAGNVHLFRQRIPIRNVDATAYQ